MAVARAAKAGGWGRESTEAERGGGGSGIGEEAWSKRKGIARGPRPPR
jgi:hypothetical protein